MQRPITDNTSLVLLEVRRLPDEATTREPTLQRITVARKLDNASPWTVSLVTRCQWSGKTDTEQDRVNSHRVVGVDHCRRHQWYPPLSFIPHDYVVWKPMCFGRFNWRITEIRYRTYFYSEPEALRPVQWSVSVASHFCSLSSMRWWELQTCHFRASDSLTVSL